MNLEHTISLSEDLLEILQTIRKKLGKLHREGINEVQFGEFTNDLVELITSAAHLMVELEKVDDFVADYHKK